MLAVLLIYRYQLNARNPGTARIEGQVLISQLKSLDYIERNSEFLEKIAINDLVQINQLVSFVFNE